ncbi:MAG TPA: hypothetical protein VFJ13_08415 [Paracoccaceae bacterium]|nr:hypothetical protein [Paracoccaceae bacterium]
MVETTPDDRDAAAGRLPPRLRRSAVVLLTTLAFAGAALLGASLVPPKYRAEASIVVDGLSPAGRAPASPPEEDAPDPVSAMTSSQLLGAVARRLDLASRKEFSRDWSLPGRFAELLGAGRDHPEGSIVEAMRERLSVHPARNLRIVVAEFAALDPVLARDVANAIVAQYLAGLERPGEAPPPESAEWLQGEIAEVEGRVRASEKRLTELRESMGEGGDSARRLSAVEAEISEARTAAAAAEAGAARIGGALDHREDLGSAAAAVEASALEALARRWSELEAQRAELSVALLGEHPRMKTLNARLGDLDEEISREVKVVQTALRRQAEDARARMASLQADASRLADAVAGIERAESELRSLERSAADDRQLLDRLLARYEEAAAAGSAGTAAKARLFAEAQLPAEPYSPKLLPIALAGGLAGFLISSLAVLLAGPSPARSRRPLAAEPGGTAPLPVEPGRPAVASKVAAGPIDEDPAAAAEAGTIGERAAAIVASAISRVVVVSPAVEEGYRGSVELARRLSSGGRTSILVDLSPCDRAARAMGIGGSAAGIGDLLAGTASVADIVRRDHFTTAHVIPSHGFGAASPTGGRLADLVPVLDALGDAYDHIILACDAAEPANLRPLMHQDAALLVAAPPGAEGEAGLVLEHLRGSGFADVLLMRGSDGVPDRHAGGALPA